MLTFTCIPNNPNVQVVDLVLCDPTVCQYPQQSPYDCTSLNHVSWKETYLFRKLGRRHIYNQRTVQGVGSRIKLESHEPTSSSYLIARCLTKWLTGSPDGDNRSPVASRAEAGKQATEERDLLSPSAFQHPN